jgi:hypothetical protein
MISSDGVVMTERRLPVRFYRSAGAAHRREPSFFTGGLRKRLCFVAGVAKSVAVELERASRVVSAADQ